MDTRTSLRRSRAALGLFVVFALAGCDDVYTIHSIAALGDGPSTVPDISGLWVPNDPHLAGLVLRITAEDYDIGHCRNADIRVLSAYTSESEEDTPIGDQICFVPVAGHLVAQLRTTGEVQLYQQALFKYDQQSMSFCAEIWTDLRKWSVDNPKASTAHGLEFAGRDQDGWSPAGDMVVRELFITSSRNAILKYFETRLPEVSKACDQLLEGGRSGWITYVRLTSSRQPDAAGAAGTPPSPQN
jgi:hypothetical protein